MRSHAKDGMTNEIMILTGLDSHLYKDLTPKWKRHMKRMFKDIKDDDYITATYYDFKDAKPDIVIKVNNRRVFVSIKSGRAPSVHYEPVATFIKFLKEMEVPKRIIKIILFYHYGFSLKKGVTDYVLSRNEIIEKYSKYIYEVNDYFHEDEDLLKEIIYRTIIRGRLDRDLIDYFYYGNPRKGFLLSITDIIDLIVGDPNYMCESICFNQLTYVSCARQKDNPRRHHIKINWPILSKWFYDIDFIKKYRQLTNLMQLYS